MSTFQIIITVLAIVYVISSLYFSISGRILAKKREEKDDEKYREQSDFKAQIDILTKRLGEIMTENDRLNGVIRHWMESSNNYKIEYQKVLQEKEEWQKEAMKLEEKLKVRENSKMETTKKGGK